jgi:UDP-glucose 4-epimerase
MSKILVTGGAGFIGSHIVDSFVAAEHDVVVVDNLCHGRREHVHPAATFYQLDIRQMDELEQIFAAERPEYVCHQAALANVRESLEIPLEYAAVNVLAGIGLLELARQYGVCKVIYASSGGAGYGEGRGAPPFHEDWPVHPVDPYGVSKIAFEYYLYAYQQNYGLDYIVLRYANVYGPRQDPLGEAGVVAIFAGRMAAGQPCIINGDGTKVRDFVYVEDVARANLLALTRGSGLVNVGTGVATDINTIYRELRAASPGYDLDPLYGPDKPGEVWVSCLDVDLAREMLSWAPAVSLSEGLARTAAYFR